MWNNIVAPFQRIAFKLGEISNFKALFSGSVNGYSRTGLYQNLNKVVEGSFAGFGYLFQVTSFERGKGKTSPKRAAPTSPANVNSPEGKRVDEPVKSATDVKSPASDSTDSDHDRRKFFQSLLQSKNGPKVDALPKTIPEESESGPNSLANAQGEATAKTLTEQNESGLGSSEQGQTETAEKTLSVESENGPNPTEQGQQKSIGEDTKDEAHTMDAQDVNNSECNEEDRSPSVEGSLSSRGSGSDLRGSEEAEEPTGHEEPNEGVRDTMDVRESEEKNSNDIVRSKYFANQCIHNEKTAADASEDASSLTSVEDKLSDDKQSDAKSEGVGKPIVGGIETLPEGDESAKDPQVSERKHEDNDDKESLQNSGNQTEVSTSPPETEIQKNVNSNEGQNLLYEKDKAKDVDSSLTIAVKSSYIGAASEVREDAQLEKDVKEDSDSQKKPVTSDVAASEDQIVSQSMENSIQKPTVESLNNDRLSQPSSPNAHSETGTESSPISTPSAMSASTSNAGSPEQKPTYRAHVNIPEYLWSPIHQRLLGDLLFAIEADVQVWRR